MIHQGHRSGGLFLFSGKNEQSSQESGDRFPITTISNVYFKPNSRRGFLRLKVHQSSSSCISYNITTALGFWSRLLAPIQWRLGVEVFKDQRDSECRALTPLIYSSPTMSIAVFREGLQIREQTMWRCTLPQFRKNDERMSKPKKKCM